MQFSHTRYDFWLRSRDRSRHREHDVTAPTATPARRFRLRAMTLTFLLLVAAGWIAFQLFMTLVTLD